MRAPFTVLGCTDACGDRRGVMWTRMFAEEYQSDWEASFSYIWFNGFGRGAFLSNRDVKKLRELENFQNQRRHLIWMCTSPILFFTTHEAQRVGIWRWESKLKSISNFPNTRFCWLWIFLSVHVWSICWSSCMYLNLLINKCNLSVKMLPPSPGEQNYEAMYAKLPDLIVKKRKR
jgi:hypothetical protein